jgi:hypothetical protein
MRQRQWSDRQPRHPLLVFLVALAAVSLAACGSTPSPSTMPPAVASPTATLAPSSPPASVPIRARFAGRIGCANFPYGCTATLSVLEPGTVVPDGWRPSPADPWWAPDYKGNTAENFDPTPANGPAAAAPGRHRFVVSLLGSYDTPSYAPDGSRAFDLLGRCWSDVEVPTAGILDVLITSSPDPASFRATCSVAAGGT